jgi:hypothetical protein
MYSLVNKLPKELLVASKSVSPKTLTNSLRLPIKPLLAEPRHDGVLPCRITSTCKYVVCSTLTVNSGKDK